MRTTIVLVHGPPLPSRQLETVIEPRWPTTSPRRHTRCQDVPAPQAALMAATQRPATQEALVEPSSDHPLWNDVPAWFLIGEEDRVIPVELQRYMAHAPARSGRP